jgi:hypothetical protein
MGFSHFEISHMPKQKTHKVPSVSGSRPWQSEASLAGTSHLASQDAERVRKLRGTTVSAKGGIAKNIALALCGNSY